MPPSRRALPLSLSLLPLLAHRTQAFLFSYTAPTSCDPLTLLWQGGSPPFTLLITPSLDVGRNFTIPSSAYSTTTQRGNYTLPLALAPGASFLLTMSDSTGFGTGGTSALLVTGPSTSGAKCDTTGPPLGFEFFLPNTGAAQCKGYEITWEANATQPVSIWGLIPLGQTFQLGPARGSSFNWDVNIATGTSFFLVLADAQGNQGGTSSIQSVGSSNDASCINANSPSSTVNSQPAQTSVSAPGSSASSSPSGGGTSQGGTTNTGAIAGGVVAGIFLLACLALLGYYFYTRHKRRESLSSPTSGGWGGKRTTFTGFGSGGRGGRGGGMIDLLPNQSHPDLPHQNSDFSNAAGRGAGGQYPSPQQYEPVPFLVPPLEEGSVDGSGGQGWRGDPFTDQPRAPGSQRTPTAPTSTTTDAATLGHGQGPAGYYVANAGLAPSALPSSGRPTPGAAKRAEARREAQSSRGGSQDWSVTGSAYTGAGGGGRRYVVHTDGGSVLDSEDPPEEEGEGEEVVVELPPAYDPSFSSRTTGGTGSTGLAPPAGGTLRAGVSGETLRGGGGSAQGSGGSAGVGEMGERQ